MAGRLPTHSEDPLVSLAADREGQSSDERRQGQQHQLKHACPSVSERTPLSRSCAISILELYLLWNRGLRIGRGVSLRRCRITHT
ncbi:hypothetical protein CEPID_04490 [Corynebacterium epidermidicanis]|uniref:Uncharacterized protein n=1 Tax=Corynebacterium epidermidicanis TaxID=1050174 RepID=A0A0G3GNP3_9CORY|nr:hypothetical protein CEPID_04490 [Corynebacterium epidermidicanis]